MMRKALKLLGLSIVTLVLSSCCLFQDPPEPRIVIKEVYHYTECVVDKQPTYVTLSETSHIGSAYNTNATTNNVAVMLDYTKSLEKTIKCYEAQIKR
jgi:hypothetical protein